MRIGRVSRSLGLVAAILVAAGLAEAVVDAQGAAPPGTPWTGRTAWGHPDLQGVWTNWDFTPFEAPDPNARRTERADPSDPTRGRADGIAGGMASVYFGPVSPRRHAVVVDPASGRVPHIVPPKDDPKREMLLMGDHWTNHSLWRRCVTMGAPGRLLGGGTGGYSKGYRLLQTPDHVVIFTEMIHETRLIPLDGRPHVGSAIRQWQGDSRGRWEGQTLVVETTNFNSEGEIGGGRQTEDLRLVERFTRQDEKTMRYEITVHDPTVFSQPWTGRHFHNLDPKYIVHEYACHEGNWRYMSGSLELGRLRDAAGSR